MITVGMIYDYLNQIAPFEMKMDFDNVGLLAGFSNEKVSKVVTALDITEEVICEAEKFGAELIVSHHPLFFSLKCASDMDPQGKKVASLLRKGLSVICMHTNLDAAEGGVNDILAKKAGIVSPQLLCVEGTDSSGREYCIGRMGTLEKEMTMDEYLRYLKVALNANGIRYYDSGKKVRKVAVVGGSGMSQLGHVLKNGCDTFLTADIKYDGFLDARAGGYNLIDGDHFCTENVVVPYIAEKIQSKFPQLEVIISKTHNQTTKFM